MMELIAISEKTKPIQRAVVTTAIHFSIRCYSAKAMKEIVADASYQCFVSTVLENNARQNTSLLTSVRKLNCLQLNNCEHIVNTSIIMSQGKFANSMK